MKRKIVLATAVAALMAGGTYTAFASSGALSGTPSASSSATSGDGAAPVTRISVTQATDAALAKFPGTLESADRDDDRGHWEIEIRATDGKEREVTVDAVTGEVRADDDRDDRDDRDDADDSDDRDDRDSGDDRDSSDSRDDDASAATAKTTARQATDAALKLHPGTVTEVQFDDGHWEVEVRGDNGKSYDVDVNATTSKATTSPDD